MVAEVVDRAMGILLEPFVGSSYRNELFLPFSQDLPDSKDRALCAARSIPMEKLDATVLQALADRVFTPKRVRVMLAELRMKLKSGRNGEDEQLRVLKRELDEIKTAQDRLYDAVEKGVLA